jgi:hypothetical protein
VHTLSAAEADRAIRRLRWLSTLLDSAVRVPGTRFRFGIDPLLGLIPGAGDAVSTLCSLYILYEAARLGRPRTVLARMTANIALDTLVGAIPILGDLFDFAFKANQRNLRLIGITPDPPE